MAVAMGDVAQQAVSFNVSLDPVASPLVLPLSPKIPAKFAERLNRRKKCYTTEQLEEKLRRAEKRRKDQETARLDRIHERQKHCQTMAHKMALLMDQDAKRHGLPGSESVKAMSGRQAAAIIKSVAKDFQKIGIGLVEETHVPKDKLQE